MNEMTPRPPLEQSVAYLHPNLAKEWHPTKNGMLKPTGVTPGIGEKVWWKCLKNPEHEWESTVGNRARGSGCPDCWHLRRKQKSYSGI